MVRRVGELGQLAGLRLAAGVFPADNVAVFFGQRVGVLFAAVGRDRAGGPGAGVAVGRFGRVGAVLGCFVHVCGRGFGAGLALALGAVALPVLIGVAVIDPRAFVRAGGAIEGGRRC